MHFKNWGQGQGVHHDDSRATSAFNLLQVASWCETKHTHNLRSPSIAQLSDGEQALLRLILIGKFDAVALESDGVQGLLFSSFMVLAFRCVHKIEENDY